jgi:hypothetical protein
MQAEEQHRLASLFKTVGANTAACILLPAAAQAAVDPAEAGLSRSAAPAAPSAGFSFGFQL